VAGGQESPSDTCILGLETHPIGAWLGCAGSGFCKSMKTLVLGASEREDRYANKAVRQLVEHHHEVVAVGRAAGSIGDVSIETGQPRFADVDTVTLYIGPRFHKDIADYVVELNPRRVIFNPGTENPEFQQLLESKGIAVEEACTLVLLSTGQF
jgi:predicted CoA-binding protein